MKSFIEVASIDPKMVVPGFNGRFIHSDQITIAYWEASAGAEIPFHTHMHEMMVNVIEGRLELTIGDETKVIEYGTVGIIPGNVPHKAKAITDCRIIDVFYPVRDDYK